MADNFDTQIDPKEAIQQVLRALKRNISRVIFMALVFFMIGLFVAKIWPDKYESTTQFVMRDWQLVDSTLLGDLEDISVTNKLRTLTAELRSRRRVEMVMNELQWVEWLETQQHPSQRRDLATKIGENLTASMEQDAIGAYNVTLAFQWTSAAKAADFVNRLRDVYIDLTLETHRRRLEEAKERAEKKVLDREVDFTNALKTQQSYERENDVPSLLSIDVNTQMKADLMLKLSDSKAELESAVQNIARLRAELDTIDKTIMIEKPPEDPEHAAALASYEGAKAAFDEIDQEYFPKHPKHIKAAKQLQAAKAALEEFGGSAAGEALMEEETNPDYYAAAKELEALELEEARQRALVESLEKELAAVNDRLEKLPVVQAEIERLKSEVAVAQELLAEAKVEVQPLREKVRQLRERALMSAGADAEVVSGSPFEILEVGLQPENPVLPIDGIIVAVALLLGIGFGALGPILREMTRSSFGTAKEVSRSLGVPVLGAVDVILTARDTRARAVQQALTFATMLLVLMAIGTALYIFQYHPNIVPPGIQRTLREVTMALV